MCRAGAPGARRGYACTRAHHFGSLVPSSVGPLLSNAVSHPEILFPAFIRCAHHPSFHISFAAVRSLRPCMSRPKQSDRSLARRSPNPFIHRRKRGALLPYSSLADKVSRQATGHKHVVLKYSTHIRAHVLACICASPFLIISEQRAPACCKDGVIQLFPPPVPQF